MYALTLLSDGWFRDVSRIINEVRDQRGLPSSGSHPASDAWQRDASRIVMVSFSRFLFPFSVLVFIWVY